MHACATALTALLKWGFSLKWKNSLKPRGKPSSPITLSLCMRVTSSTHVSIRGHLRSSRKRAVLCMIVCCGMGPPALILYASQKQHAHTINVYTAAEIGPCCALLSTIAPSFYMRVRGSLHFCTILHNGSSSSRWAKLRLAFLPNMPILSCA